MSVSERLDRIYWPSEAMSLGQVEDNLSNFIQEGALSLDGLFLDDPASFDDSVNFLLFHG